MTPPTPTRDIRHGRRRVSLLLSLPPGELILLPLARRTAPLTDRTTPITIVTTLLLLRLLTSLRRNPHGRLPGHR